MKKEMKAILAYAANLGFTEVTRGVNGGHIKLKNPETNRAVFCSFSPSDKRAYLNIKRDINHASCAK